MAFHSPSPPPTDGLHHSAAPPITGKKPFAAMIVGVIFMVIFFFFLIYANSPIPQQINSSRRRRLSFAPDDPLIPLDACVVEALPVFEYKAQSFKDVLECAICLSEFQENEKGRFLPNCEHSFHVDCIDMWFHSHSTCPVCRTDVEPKQRVSNGNNDEISINVELVSSGNREFGISPGLAQGETSSHETETAEQITIHERNVLDAGNRH